MKKLCFSLIILSIGTTVRSEPWHLESDHDGIKVYSKREADNPILSLKGETILDYPIEQVFHIFEKPDHYEQWMPMVKHSKVIEDISHVKKKVYLHIDMPWPLTDRFFVNVGEMKEQAKDHYIIEVKSVPFTPDENEDKVEGWTHFSYFKLQTLDGGRKTKIEVELNQDPRGLVPSFMVNIAQKKWPRDFFTQMNLYLGKQQPQLESH